MYWLKGCRTCQGDLYRSEDSYGSYISCMHCSRYLTNAEDAEIMGLSRPKTDSTWLTTGWRPLLPSLFGRRMDPNPTRGTGIQPFGDLEDATKTINRRS